MLLLRSFLAATLLLLAGRVQAISFDCVPPVFPSRPPSQDQLRRVEQQVQAWNACYAAFSARHRNIDATRQDHEVAIQLEKWSASLHAARAAPAASAAGMRASAQAQSTVYSRDRR